MPSYLVDSTPTTACLIVSLRTKDTRDCRNYRQTVLETAVVCVASKGRSVSSHAVENFTHATPDRPQEVGGSRQPIQMLSLAEKLLNSILRQWKVLLSSSPPLLGPRYLVSTTSNYQADEIFIQLDRIQRMLAKYKSFDIRTRPAVFIQREQPLQHFGT